MEEVEEEEEEVVVVVVAAGTLRNSVTMDVRDPSDGKGKLCTFRTIGYWSSVFV